MSCVNPYVSKLELVTLHTLFLKGWATPKSISLVSGFPLVDVSHQMSCDEARGLVRWSSGRVSGWRLTASGEDEHRRRLADEKEDFEHSILIGEAYQRFLSLNSSFKKLCFNWQVEQNYSRSVAGLAYLHKEAQPITRRLAERLLRMQCYCQRLDNAFNRFRSGDTDALTRPLSESYHDIWMELHADLLSTLGRQRSPSDD